MVENTMRHKQVKNNVKKEVMANIATSKSPYAIGFLSFFFTNVRTHKKNFFWTRIVNFSHTLKEIFLNYIIRLG